MVMDGAMGTMIQSYHLTEEQFRGLLHLVSICILHLPFDTLSLSISLSLQVKSSRTILRVSKATMIYSVSLNLTSSMRYTRYADRLK